MGRGGSAAGVVYCSMASSPTEFDSCTTTSTGTAASTKSIVAGYDPAGKRRAVCYTEH